MAGRTGESGVTDIQDDIETTRPPLLVRLRADRKAAFYGMPDALCEEAADEIERLRAELAAANTRIIYLETELCT